MVCCCARFAPTGRYVGLSYQSVAKLVDTIILYRLILCMKQDSFKTELPFNPAPGAPPVAPSKGTVPRPRSHWFLRYVLPMMILSVAGLMLMYAARDALLPVVEVEAVPVLTKAPTENATQTTGSTQTEPTIVAQAPGWIEPAPYAVSVQALVPGVVKEVLVLEGDRVKKGQIVARLIDEDAKLAHRRAEAELHERHAAAEEARASVTVAQARLDEIADEIERKRSLVDAGGVSLGELVRLQHRLRSLQGELDAARAAVRRADAFVEQYAVAVDEAKLALDRTVIHAPIDGVVLLRAVIPGTRISLAGTGPGEAHFPGVVKLYDPSSLQVRAEVPLSDTAKVGIGTRATITTQALPDETFDGEVTRIIHLADIQRNTVQVKVAIRNPSPLLKPEMLVRVRFFGGREEGSSIGIDHSTPESRRGAGSLLVYAATDAVLNREADRGQVWVIEPGADGRSRLAALRDITLGDTANGLIHVRSGLRPGDRLIVNPQSDLKPGARVRPRHAPGAAPIDQEGH
jgi:HlyD family secretion protein